MASPERWRPVAGFEERYEVSDQGRVRAVFRVRRQPPPPRVLRAKLSGKCAYRYVSLVDASGVKRSRTVHTLVLEAFVGPKPPGQQGRHVDGDNQRNVATNLVWGTQVENMADMVRHGRAGRNRGERNAKTKLTPERVRQIRRELSSVKRAVIARRHAVSTATISSIARRKAWAHV